MDTVLLTPLKNIESSLNTLVHSLTSTNTFSAAPSAAKELVSADEALVSALQTLKTHQEKYQRILQLRTEADSLNQRLKDIVRTCVAFRTEIGEIHPSILLEDTDDEEAEEEEHDGDHKTTLATKNAKEVDYETLLSFAARIGKHNALASRAVDEEATRRKVEARRKREEQQQQQRQQAPQSQSQSQQQPNLNNGSNSVSRSPDADGANNTTTLTQESQANLAAIDNDLAAQRAYMGQAFPAADRLRMGALGQLQLLKERSGEDAVDREIERLVKESELGIIDSEESVNVPGTTIPAVPVADGGGGGGLEAPAAAVVVRTDKAPADAAAGASGSDAGTAAERPPQRRQSVVQPQPPPPPPPKKKVLDLDFPGSDDEDED